MIFPEGKVVIGKIVNTAIGTAAEIVFKDINGNTHTFANGERLIIDTIHINNRATAKDVTVFQDADGSAALNTGEEMMVFSFTAAGIFTDIYVNGLPSLHINAAGTNKFYAFGSAAGAVDIFVIGQVIKD